VLVVDDEPRLRELYARILSLEGYRVLTAATRAEGRERLRQQPVHLVLTDVRLPDGSGLEWVPELRAQHPLTEVVVVTAYGTVADGVRAMKMGAFDYLVKGDSDDQIVATVASAVEKAQLRRRVAELERGERSLVTFEHLVAASAAMQRVVAEARRVAVTEASVLLQGETGVGKELMAQAIHSASARAARPFVAVNCAAIPHELIESELFGYRKGAFTGALGDKQGLFEAADGGTLLLDEIGDLPLELQAKLLRALDAQAFVKLGDTRPTQVNLRVIAATHRDLRQAIEAQRFRADLYYRLAVVTLQLPPLRARAEDIPVLVQRFAEQAAAKLRRATPTISADALAHLAAYPWPGNLRELRNAIERAVILGGNPIEANDLPLELTPPTPQHASGADPTDLSLDTAERAQIARALQQTGGNRARAARLLGIGVATLYRRLERYGLH